MPRSRGGGGGGGRRPSAVPSRPAAAPTPQQARPSSTAAHPPQQQQAPPQQGQSPGLFGQMASTAAGVAVGSSIGHAIGGMFGGGSTAEAPPAQSPEVQQPLQSQQQGYGPPQCDFRVKELTNCMNENGGNMGICNWYLEQLKACQMAARQGSGEPTW